MKIELNTIIWRNPDQLFTEIDDEIIMLNIANEEYYSLSKTGKQIWINIENKVTVGKLIDILSNIFDVTQEKCFHDITPFIEELFSVGIIYLQKE